jgi:Rrf2 family transcriptional regulator, nitric oxide-sensitive transcriptional repressor
MASCQDGRRFADGIGGAGTDQMHMNPSTNGALRILMACRHAEGRPLTMPEMVKRLGLSESLVVKACHELMRAGYLDGRRGNGGGYRLARPAEAIDVMEIITLLEDEERLFPCRMRSDGECRIAGVCLLRRACEAAHEVFKAELRGWTLADITAEPGVPFPVAAR